MKLISNLLSNVQASPTIAMSSLAAEMAAQGHDIITLSAGEPDFPTPIHICDAAKAAIDAGHTRYTKPDGMPALKEAIVDKFQRENGLTYQTEQISVGTGGKQILFNALKATLNPGDEVIIPAPYWVSYPDMARLCGATPVIIACPAQTGFKLTPEALKAALTPNSKWLILNSPGNPSGALYSQQEIDALAEIALAHPRLLILADDIYEHIRFDGAPFYTPAQHSEEMAARTLICNGVSKSYAMTGWRIGYGAGPKTLIDAMRVIQSQSTSNPCSISQHAALAALTGPQDYIASSCAAFERRRNLVLEALSQIDGIHCDKPQGAFYLYPSIRDLLGRTAPNGTKLTDDQQFSMTLLRESGVAVVFGAAFGLEGHFRISYAASDAQLSEACDRIAGFCQSLRS